MRPGRDGESRIARSAGRDGATLPVPRMPGLARERADGGSIDPGRETLRATQWRTGRASVWNSRRGNHLGQRSCAIAPTGRTYGCKRTEPNIRPADLKARGRPHMGCFVAALLAMTEVRTHRARHHRPAATSAFTWSRIFAASLPWMRAMSSWYFG